MKPNQALRELRETLELNQMEFANKIGKGYSTVQAWEGGSNIPPMPELARLYNIAQEVLRPDLARAFRQAIIDSLPPEVVTILRDDSTLKATPIEASSAISPEAAAQIATEFMRQLAEPTTDPKKLALRKQMRAALEIENLNQPLARPKKKI